MRSLNRLKWLHAFEATAAWQLYRRGTGTWRYARRSRSAGTLAGRLGRAPASSPHPLRKRAADAGRRSAGGTPDITQGLDKLETGLNKLRGRRSRSVVVVTASQVLMMNWLMDRLNRFAESHENIDLRLNVTEKLMDVSHGEADIGIRCGQGDWPGVNKTADG